MHSDELFKWEKAWGSGQLKAVAAYFKSRNPGSGMSPPDPHLSPHQG